jgi:hypothetical protein
VNEDGNVRVVVPGHLGEPDIAIYVTELRGLPPVVDANFLTKQLGLATPSGSHVSIEGTRDDLGANGWPLTVVRGSVMAGGVLIEQRLAAFYRILDQFAAVIVVGKDPQRWKDLAEGLGEIVLAANVDWSGPPASLAEILGLGADHAIFKR